MVKGWQRGLKQSFCRAGSAISACLRRGLSDLRHARIGGLPRHGHQPDPRHDRPLRYAVPRHACHAERHCRHRHGSQRVQRLLRTDRAFRAPRRGSGCAVLRERVPDAAQLQGAQALVCVARLLAHRRCARAGVHRLHRHHGRTGITFWRRAALTASFFTSCAAQGARLSRAGGLQRRRAFKPHADFTGKPGTKPRTLS